jgi:hypothetical protein
MLKGGSKPLDTFPADCRRSRKEGQSRLIPLEKKEGQSRLIPLSLQIDNEGNTVYCRNALVLITLKTNFVSNGNATGCDGLLFAPDQTSSKQWLKGGESFRISNFENLLTENVRLAVSQASRKFLPRRVSPTCM